MILVLIMIIAVLGFIGWLLTPLSPQYTGRWVRRVATREKVIALTFDDGPSPEWTPKLLHVLARHNVLATFFVVGKQVAAYPQLASQLWQAGHQVGNHTWAHALLLGKSQSFVRNEIEKTDTTLRNIGYSHTISVRVPYGIKGWRVPRVLAKMHRLHVLFDVVSWDWNNPGAQVIASRVCRAAHPGAIVLLHDGGGNRAQTIQATEEIIVRLKGQGYRFVTVDQLVAMAA